MLQNVIYVAKCVWPDLRWCVWKIRGIENVSTYPGLVTFWNFHLPEKNPTIGNVAKLLHFVTVRRSTYDVIGQWPDLTWKWKQFHNVRHQWRISLANFQLSITNGCRAISRSPSSEGWHPLPSTGDYPSPVRRGPGGGGTFSILQRYRGKHVVFCFDAPITRSHDLALLYEIRVVSYNTTEVIWVYQSSCELTW